MSNISDDPEYRRIKNELDSSIRELAAYANQWAEDQGEEGQSGPLVVSGWILTIGVTMVNDDGEFDDALPESNFGINSYMALGLSKAGYEHWTNAVMGYNDED